MLDMNSCHLLVRTDNILTDISTVAVKERIQVDLTKTPPLDRAKLMIFLEKNNNYVFSSSEIVSLNTGYVPEFILNYYNKLLMDRAYEDAQESRV